MRFTWKDILKPVLITLLCAVIAVAFVLLMLSFFAPIAMARFVGSMGMYEQSAWFCEVQYADGKGDVECLYDAMKYSLQGGDHKMVITYGERLAKDSRFETLCEKKDEGKTEEEEGFYQQIYGRISVSYYRLNEKEKALETAFSVNQTEFEKYNAVTDLLFYAIGENDKDFIQELASRLSDLDESDTVTVETNLKELKEYLFQE